MQSIVRTYADENDQTSEQDLLVNQEGEGKVPIIRGDDEWISLEFCKAKCF